VKFWEVVYPSSSNSHVSGTILARHNTSVCDVMDSRYLLVFINCIILHLLYGFFVKVLTHCFCGLVVAYLPYLFKIVSVYA